MTSPNFTPQQPPKTPEQLAKEWWDLQVQLKTLKDREKKARDAALAANFPKPREGTNTCEFPSGPKLKAQYNTKRKFVVPDGVDVPASSADKAPDVNDAVDHMIERLRRASNEGAFIAERLVKWKPEISNSEYNALDDKLRRIVDEYIETSFDFASPSIQFPKS